MKRFAAVIAFLALVLASCGVSRESEDTLDAPATDSEADTDTEAEESADGDDAVEGGDDAVEGDDAVPTTLAPTTATTGAPGDVALTVEFEDATWEITHGELNELVVSAQDNEEFVTLIFGGVPPAGFDVGVLTQQLTAEAVSLELDAVGAEVSDELRAETEADLLTQIETFFAGQPEASDEAQRLYEEVAYLPFLVDLQAGQIALSEALAESSEASIVPCVRHILVETEAEADAAFARAEAGEEFADLAVELSTGPSGPEGGNLGCEDSSLYVPSFAEAVDGAEIGVVLAPVQTDFGWHVILVESEEEAAPDGQVLLGERLQERLGGATVAVDENLGNWDPVQLAVLPLQ